MRNITGSPVEGNDFFGRVDELDKLLRLLRNGNHVLLLGPRRMGKSSMVAEIGRRLKKEGWKIVRANVEDATDEPALLREIHHAIRDSGIDLPILQRAEGLISAFREKFRGSKAQGILGDESWESAADALKQVFANVAPTGKVLFTLDELPIFLSTLVEAEDGPNRVRSILRWLRSTRHKCGTNLPWLLCGSIGLDTFVERNDLTDTINELLSQELGAFSPEEGRELIRRLGKSPGYDLDISDEVADAMVDRVGWPVPFYLQLMFHGLAELPLTQRSTDYASLADVDAAYELLLSPSHRVKFAHWDSRLGDLLDRDDARLTRLILTEVAHAPKGLSRRQLLNAAQRKSPGTDADEHSSRIETLLSFLQRDGYLIEKDGRYTFRSFLLRDYWKRKYSR